MSVFPVCTLNTETIPSDSYMATACLISCVLIDGKVNNLQQVLASSVFRALSLSPISQVVTGYFYEFQVCAGVGLFVQVGEHISSQAVSMQLVQELQGVIVSHQNSSHTTGVSVGIPGQKTLSDLKYITFQYQPVYCPTEQNRKCWLMPVVQRI